ncbi:ATP-dependent DNA helicase RecQ-like [Argopecten irradians]|uniref:ATP-dependent DNA helicase RecQ-like n=1 Tax=Argopecten irradians TaxID=31199 RepID=UPI0037199723
MKNQYSVVKNIHLKIFHVTGILYIFIRGQDDKEQRKKAFRKWFGELGELRSLFPNATLLALSATCTLKVQQRVMKAVMFRHNYTYVYVSPDKRNIKFVIKKSPNDVEMAFTWLVDGLLQGNTFPRILVYCKSIGEVAKIYDYITDELPDHLKCSISMFHSETEEMVKEHVLSSISDSESELRVIVSTNALGMGVDFKKLSGIILYGPPNSMLDVVQEIGRAGRDGEKAVAILVHNSHHLRQCDPDVKKLYQKNECRRLSMMESFLKEDELEKLKSNIGDCTCCDICQATCTCGDCSLLPLEKLFLGDSSVDEVESDNPDDDDFSDDAELEDIDLGDYD